MNMCGLTYFALAIELQGMLMAGINPSLLYEQWRIPYLR